MIQWVAAEIERHGGKHGLPVGEFTHPVSLGSLALLAINDHLLKGADLLPGWLTGKISDFAGLIFFPLMLTAILNTALFGIDRLIVLAGGQPRLDYRLSNWKLVFSCLFTGLLFASIQLWETAAGAYEGLVRAVGFSAHVTMDPTDLVALVSLVIAYLVGVSVIRRQRN